MAQRAVTRRSVSKGAAAAVGLAALVARGGRVAAAPAVAYTLTDLGILAGGTASVAARVSSAVQVAGYGDAPIEGATAAATGRLPSVLADPLSRRLAPGAGRCRNAARLRLAGRRPAPIRVTSRRPG
jgi:hypothetical protein